MSHCKLKKKYILLIVFLLALAYVLGVVNGSKRSGKSFNLITHGWFLDANDYVEAKGTWFNDEPTTIVCRKNFNLCVESAAGVVKSGGFNHLMIDQFYWRILSWNDVIVSKLDMPEVNDNLHWLLCINRKTKQVYKVDASKITDYNKINVKVLEKVKVLQ